MQGKSLNGYPFRIDTNVNAKVVGPNRELKQNIDKHNMATANLTEGVVKFLRGEFTESYISGLIPTIGHHFNIADQYIPAYMGMGVAGVSYTADQQDLVVTSPTGFAPSYADQALISEILPVTKPGRAIVNRSSKSNGLLSQAATLLLTTAYHFEAQAESQTFVLAPSADTIPNGAQFYLSDSVFPGRKIKQRIKSITPQSAGWTYEETTEAEQGIYATGVLSYTEFIKTTSNETKSQITPVLSVDLNTGVLTVIADEFTFNSGLKIDYDPVNFDFIYADGSPATVPYVRDAETFARTYYISELGLFSGDIGNDKSKLLARVLFDSDTPLKITEGDYVLITWQIGVYALDDALYSMDIETAEAEESATYKYVTQEEQTTLLWETITAVDDDGNVVQEETASVPNAVYTVRSIDLKDIDSGLAVITIDSVDAKTRLPVPLNTLYKGFEANFSCLGGTLFGTIEDIEHIVEFEEGVAIEDYYKLLVYTESPDAYIDNPFVCYADQAVLSTALTCSQQLLTIADEIPNDITFTYNLRDVTKYNNLEFTTEHQSESSQGLSSQSVNVLNSAICNFAPIYYLLGTETIPENGDTPEIILDKNSSMFYFLGRISELYAADIGNIVYEYSLTQNFSDTDLRPVIFDSTEYRIRVVIAPNITNNQRDLILRCFKYTYDPTTETESYERVGKDNDFNIIFKNVYNPIIQKGD